MKIAPLVVEMRRVADVEQVLVQTGQPSDENALGKPMTLEFLQCYSPILNPVELILS